MRRGRLSAWLANSIIRDEAGPDSPHTRQGAGSMDPIDPQMTDQSMLELEPSTSSMADQVSIIGIYAKTQNI